MASSRRTVYAFDDAGTPSRRVAGSTKWTALPGADPGGLPRELAVAADDTLYAEYCRDVGCSLWRLRGETWAELPLPAGELLVRGLAVDARDDLWLAGTEALWRRRASARAPVDAGTPTDRSADAPLAADVAASEEPIEPWERVALPRVRMPALALPRAVFGVTREDLTWHVRPERPNMANATGSVEIRAIRARGDELWISGRVDDAAVVLTTRAMTPFALPDLYVDSPNEYTYPDPLAEDGCPAVALRLGAVSDEAKLLAALADAPLVDIAVIVADDPRELVAVWTAEIDTAIGMEGDLFLTRPAELAAAKAGLTALGARLTDLGVAPQAELACWAPIVARVLATPRPRP